MKRGISVDEPQLAGRSLHSLVRLPKWAQEHIRKLEARVERAEKTIPWTAPGMEWFTMFWPGPDPRYRAPESLFTCDKGGTHMVCTLGPTDWVFIGRGKKPNPTADRRATAKEKAHE